MGKILIKLIIISFSSCLLFSCKTENNNITKVHFEIIDSIKLKLPKYIAGGNGVPQTCVFENDEMNIKKLYLLVGNRAKKQNEILTFDLIKRDTFSKIILPYEGNNSYKFTTGLAVKNIDSIFVVSHNYPFTFLLNSKGKLIKKTNHEYTSKIQTVLNINAHLWSPFHFLNDNIYFIPALDGYSDFKNSGKQSISFRLNLKTDKVESLNFTIPKSFVESPFFEATNFSKTLGPNDNFVYSADNSHNIWVTDVNHKLKKTINTKSKYFRSFEIKNPTNDISFEYLVNSKYNSIIYDKYRKVYYRFFYPGIDDVKKGDEKNTYKSYNLNIFSIIVLDEEFNIIEEILMPKDTYVFRNYFITKEGLNINANHESNPNYNEDTLIYHTLKLVR